MTENYLTLRKLLDRIERRDGKEALEKAMDMPLFVGCSDQYTNFATLTLYDDWPRINYPHPQDGGNYTGTIRIDGHMPDNKCMREVKKR